MLDPYDLSVDAAECGLLSASCLTPSQLAALRARRAQGLPIDLVEPCPSRVEGDRVPCHPFLVDLPEPLPPVLREDRPPQEGFDGSTDLFEPPHLGAVVAMVVGFWVFGAAAIVGASSLGWL